MEPGLYKSIVWVHALIGVLARRGIESKELFSGVAIEPSMLADSRARIALSEWRVLVKRTMELTDDPGLGLTIASTVPDSIYQVLAPMFGASRSLREGLRLFERYRPLMGNMNRFDMVEEGERAYVKFSPICPDPEIPQFDAELGLSLVYRVPQRYAKHESDDADEIWFMHPEPVYAARYAQVFRCPVRFSRPRNAILFSRRFLDEEQIHANPALLEVLKESGDRLLSERGNTSLPDQVRALLRHDRDMRGVGPERIAKALNLSVRSFRRKLGEAGASWSTLLDEVRCQIACEELRRGITIVELTERLGFSEQSAFNRAFKRWTGTTPARFGTRSATDGTPSVS
jgi:AraC-like DNA-binding protein